jgi:hypothetical protein
MKWLYAVSLVVGMLSLIVWALRQSVRRGDSGTQGDSWGPRVIAGAVAFGMGGMSASFAGWNPWVAAGAAVVAAVAGVMLARLGDTVGDQDHD